MCSRDEPYRQRVADLDGLLGFSASDPRSRHLVFVTPTLVRNLAELEAFETKCLDEGYEGVMVRTPHSPYKCGRSTEREAWLLKIKRFEDAEAVVLEPYEGMTNQNAAELDNFGRTKRSLAQTGMIGRGELGGFIVRHLSTGVEFRLGYNHIVGGVDRVTLWMDRDSLIGKVVKFSHQPSGAKDAPRFPKFIGFREAWDM